MLDGLKHPAARHKSIPVNQLEATPCWKQPRAKQAYAPTEHLLVLYFTIV